MKKINQGENYHFIFFLFKNKALQVLVTVLESHVRMNLMALLLSIEFIIEM